MSESKGANDKLDRLFKLADDSQYLKAAKMWEDIKEGQSIDAEDVPDRRQRLKLKEILHRASEVRSAMEIEDFPSDSDTDGSDLWKLGAEYWGIKTYYKVENGRIRVRMEGGLDELPLFEQCAVIHEVDLFNEWIPFCRESRLVEKLGKAELFMYLCVSPLFLSRDTCLHAYGADCLYETGQIILIGRSIDHMKAAPPSDSGEDRYGNGDGHYEVSSENGTILGVESSTSTIKHACNTDDMYACPWKKETWRHKRMEVTEFNAIFKPTNNKAASAVIVACVDPNLPQLHPGIINFVIKKMAGLALYFFQKRVSEVAKTEDSSTSSKMRENPHFYTDWLFPKVQQYYEHRGWEMGVVPSLIAIGSHSTAATYVESAVAGATP
jgi:hypothetical protein